MKKLFKKSLAVCLSVFMLLACSQAILSARAENYIADPEDNDISINEIAEEHANEVDCTTLENDTDAAQEANQGDINVAAEVEDQDYTISVVVDVPDDEDIHAGGEGVLSRTKTSRVTVTADDLDDADDYKPSTPSTNDIQALINKLLFGNRFGIFPFMM